MTMQLIESYTVPSGGVSSVTFSAIPDTFTDLKILVSARGSGSQPLLLYRLNDVSSGYSHRILAGNANGGVYSVTTTTETAAAGGAYGRLTAEGTNRPASTANTFSNVEIYIPNYLSTVNKSLSADVVTESNDSTFYAQQEIVAGLVTLTSAVTSITLAVLSQPSAVFVQYSSFSLFGIQSGSDGIVAVS